MIRLAGLTVAVVAVLGASVSAAEREPRNSETSPGEPMPAEEAASTMVLPEGFTATVFAAEPDVRNPIACSWDAQGRLWVAENLTYERLGGQLAADQEDRVLVFSDRDGDGVQDERVVFVDGLSQLTGIEWTPGGLWAICPPRLLFIPDADRDDVPDQSAITVLDGFDVPPGNHHNFANGLRMGADGWLYGRCGASAPGEVGVPGTGAAERVPLRGGMWRYHPSRKVFEVLNHGTTNPWGHAWNEEGELFFINTVNGHFFHSIAGAHYKRGVSRDPNPLVYEEIGMHADHWHFDRKGSWSKSRDGAANEFGGGHAHVGLMIYQGDNWPEVYRGRAFTLNLHGRRCNQELIERRGSGYVIRHAPDFFISKDPFFRGIELTCGPDGGVYVLDWSDTGECHEASGVHRSSGRIYKIVYGGQPKREELAMSSLSDLQLAEMHARSNVWFSRMARMELVLRGASPVAIKALQRLADRGEAPSEALRARQTLSLLGESAGESVAFQHANEFVRAWEVGRVVDSLPLDTIAGRVRVTDREFDALGLRVGNEMVAFEELAARESSGLVRLKLASALQRLPLGQRAALAIRLAARKEDAGDHNLALMIWYGLMPLARERPGDLVEVALASELPQLRRLIVRRLIESEAGVDGLKLLLAEAMGRDVSFQLEVLTGLEEGSQGRQRLPMPEGWREYADSLSLPKEGELGNRLRSLEVLFGDGRALSEVRSVAMDKGAGLSNRQAALRSLIQARPDYLAEICAKLLKENPLSLLAAEGLVAIGDPRAGKAIVNQYRRMPPGERSAVIELLVSRVEGADALLDGIEKGKVPRSDLGPYHARSIRLLSDSDLSEKLAKVWGVSKEGGEAQRKLIEEIKGRFAEDRFSGANPGRGRELFEQLCASCHVLYGKGNAIGPELTGSGRDNLDYLLENVVTPAASLSQDYYLTSITMEDGRSLSGVLKSENAETLRLQTLVRLEVIEKKTVSSRREDAVSLMPPGLLESLAKEDQESLLVYLMSPTQVAPPKGRGDEGEGK